MSNRSASDLGARSEILSIQYLRGLAATMVVMRHAFQELGFLGHPMGGGFLLGSAGVDVFFVISGFIMVWMVDTRPVGPLTFLWSRFTRVAPPYWIITGVVVVGLVVAPGMFGSSKLEARHALLSFLFLPAAHPTMGDAVPLYQPGWSLNYEMIFYVSFAALLVFASAMRLAMLWGLGTLIVAAGAFLSPEGAVERFYTNAIVLEFCLGCTIGHIYVKGVRLRARWASLLALSGLALLVVLDGMFTVYRESGLRLIVWGVPATLLVLGLVQLEAGSPRFPKWRWLRHIGDASYSIYITHLFVVTVLGHVLVRLVDSETLLFAPMFLGLCFISSLFAGSIFHVVIEKPITRWIRTVQAIQAKARTPDGGREEVPATGGDRA